MPGLEQIDPRKIWKNYVIALSLIFVLVSVSHFAELLVGGDAHKMATDIKIGGQQSTLSQRVLYFAATYQHSGYSNTAAQEGLRIALNQFEHNHAILVEHATEPTLRALYFGEADSQRLDETAQRFVKDAHMILTSDVASRDQYVNDLRVFAPTELFKKLDNAVHLYESISQANSTVVERSSMIGYILALCALVFEAIFIFRPSHQTIVMAFAQLHDTKSQLENREQDAVSALEEAEEAWAEAEEARVKVERSHGLAKARMCNAGYELMAPMSALKSALEEATMATSVEEQVGYARSALSFADVADQMRDHLMRADPVTDQSDPSTHSVFDLRTLVKMAVGTVSACSPEKAPITLHLPQGKTPILNCNTLAVYRIIVHLLRDAQDVDGTQELDLAVDVEVIEKQAKVSFALTQNIQTDDAPQGLGVGASDKRLSDVDIRAAALKGLVADVEGEASVTRTDQTRVVSLTFPAKLQRYNRATKRQPHRRAG